ncbi:hypothetical protein H696_04680 [Fonticula alba]|uniref:Uncharacterized protein n=1 Tax=Fonticula alba TaxID=691883 RepID=A0A058Z2N3_FONAL|nr:hypothetical protein H696_04680 [Fonticula alba]KCV68391.1 hypothetical protein H696_04680 [Fonticula alba]|eukprot:XP_009496823.1 hypothetical protein H696_04680 [Fonticula alba]
MWAFSTTPSHLCGPFCRKTGKCCRDVLPCEWLVFPLSSSPLHAGHWFPRMVSRGGQVPRRADCRGRSALRSPGPPGRGHFSRQTRSNLSSWAWRVGCLGVCEGEGGEACSRPLSVFPSRPGAGLASMFGWTCVV